jgi:hypothetical protein
MGDKLPPRGGSLRPPRPEPRRRRKRKRLGRARVRPPPGILRERRRTAWRHRCAPLRRLGGEAVATLAAATASAEPPRKRKRGFSTLR